MLRHLERSSDHLVSPAQDLAELLTLESGKGSLHVHFLEEYLDCLSVHAPKVLSDKQDRYPEQAEPSDAHSSPKVRGE